MPVLSLPPVRRFAASAVLLLLIGSSVLPPFPVQAAGDTANISRREFLEEAVGTLFGELTEHYTVPFTGVPEELEQAVGLVYVLDALQGWERSREWHLPVSRGQALKILSTLLQIAPASEKVRVKPFRDVHEGDLPTAAWAVDWGLLRPLTEHSFGWNRALAGSELQGMLDVLSTKLSLPLPAPTNVVRSRVPAPDAARKRVKQTPRTKVRKKGKGISVEFSIDRGSRGIPREDLPKNDLLSSLWGLIQSRYLYLENVKEEEVGYALAEKLMGLLSDPYSTFFRPSSAKSFQQQLEGELSGIGAQVESHPEGGVMVVSPLTGSPALAAGLKPGDRITHVNGESILELDLHAAVEKIRGPVDTIVELTVVRTGATLSFKIVRAKITIPEIEMSFHENIAVVRLFQFGERTIRDLGTILQDAVSKKPTGMILDLRNNPGGLLDAAIAVLEHFFPHGTVIAKIKTREDIHEEVTRGTQIVPEDLPMVVIVNGGSASASEIVAGALQDLNRALVIGVKTFGKGTVQEVVQFPTGEGAKLTTGEWFTPHGRSIQKEGIKPDIPLEEGAAGSRDELLLEALRIIKAKARRS